MDDLAFDAVAKALHKLRALALADRIALENRMTKIEQRLRQLGGRARPFEEVC